MDILRCAGFFKQLRALLRTRGGVPAGEHDADRSEARIGETSPRDERSVGLDFTEPELNEPARRGRRPHVLVWPCAADTRLLPVETV